MSYKVEDLGKNMVKLTIEVPADEFEKAIQKTYNKEKSKIQIPGFRKGKVPRALIEKEYGKEVFYEGAANEVIPGAYENAYKEAEKDGIKIVSRPKIDVETIEAGKPFVFTAEVAKEPEVTLGEYKGIQVEKTEISVSEDEVNDELNRVREQNAREINVDDRAAESGDIANINFDGYMDGKQFDGGKSDNYNLTLGSHSFIDTFEDQIIGKNIGDEFDVNVTFPEDYGQKELAGKPAVFKVKLNSLKKKELPELDDEFAGEVSEFDTLDEYKKDVEKTIRERKENEAKSAKEDKVVAAIVEKATMEIPEAMIETEQQTTLEQFAQRLRYQGLTFDQYLQFSGQTKKSMLEQVKPEAEKRIKSNLVLKAIAKAENLQATDEEVDAELEKMGKQYNMKAEDLKKNLGEAELTDIKENIVIGKAVDLVRDAAVEA